MTPTELRTLIHFREGERDLGGRPIDWALYDYRTMYWVSVLRELLDSPIRLIRGAHPGKPTAIDFCCPGVPLSRMVMEACRIPEVSIGIYSGNSVHVDRREYINSPARWLAIKPDEVYALYNAGLSHLAMIPPRDGWVYLPWSGVDGWACLQVVLDLADRAAGRPDAAHAET